MEYVSLNAQTERTNISKYFENTSLQNKKSRCLHPAQGSNGSDCYLIHYFIWNQP